MPAEVYSPVLLDSQESLQTIDPLRVLAPNQQKWVEETTVSLLTVGPGDPLYAWFGHSALIVSLPSGTKVMYDWGIFDYNQEHFYLNFARGRMYYYVLQSNARWRIDEAIEEGRDVRLIDLKLTPSAQFAIIEYLQTYVGTSPSTYLYHFYDDNCSTRIRDIINVATDGAFEKWAKGQSTGKSIRELADSFMMHRPFTNWVLSALQGPSIDQKVSRWEAMFLPLELERAIIDFTDAQGSSLAANVEEVAVATKAQIDGRSPMTIAIILSLSLLFLLQVLGLAAPSWKRTFLAFCYLFLAVLGSVLLFMMVASDMDMTYANRNVLIINPLLFIPALFLLVGKRKHSLIITLFFAATVVLFGLGLRGGQANLTTTLVLLPLYLSGAAFKRSGNIKRVEAIEVEAPSGEDGRKR